MSASDYIENKLLDHIFKNTAYTSPTNVYVKLHKDGSAGENGTTNAAGNTTRQAVTFGSASSGTITSNADVTWTNVSTSETYYAISLWDNSTAGNCLWSGDLTAQKTVVAGDTFTIPSGSLTVSLD